MSQVPVKKYKKYSHQDLLNAVATVKQSGMPILQAAKYFNIPRKTLSDHLKGKQKGGWSTYLDVEKEKALVEYALYMGDNATPVTRKGMMEAAGNVNSKYSQKHFTNGVPTQGWWHGFKQRHPELSLRSSSNVDGGRCAMSRASVVEKHFDLLGKTLLENNLLHKPHRIFNSDETGFGDKCDSSRERGIFRKGSKFPYHRQVKLRDHISVNYCASATGMIIPPLVIFEKTVPVNAEEKGPAGAIYRANESGFMSEDLYLTWFSECFIPNCGCDPDIPVILIQDNHSTHMGYCLREKAIEHNILIYNLPAHSSHILQPMDMFFAAFKNKFTAIARDASLLRQGAVVNKSNFPAVLRATMSSFPSSVYTNVFKATGIHPFNRNAIDRSKLIGDPPQPKSLDYDSMSVPLFSMECSTEIEECTESAMATHQNDDLDIVLITQNDFDCDSTGENVVLESIGTQTDTIEGACTACNTNILEHPLVKSKRIPEYLANELWVPHTMAKPAKKKECQLGARIITDKDNMKKKQQQMERKLQEEQMKEKKRLERIKARDDREKLLEEMKRERQIRKAETAERKEKAKAEQRAIVEQRKCQREIKRAMVAEEKRKRQEKRKQKSSQSRNFVDVTNVTLDKECTSCLSLYPPGPSTSANDEEPSWYCCIICCDWYHSVCCGDEFCTPNTFICISCILK